MKFNIYYEKDNLKHIILGIVFVFIIILLSLALTMIDFPDLILIIINLISIYFAGKYIYYIVKKVPIISIENNYLYYRSPFHKTKKFIKSSIKLFDIGKTFKNTDVIRIYYYNKQVLKAFELGGNIYNIPAKDIIVLLNQWVDYYNYE